MDRIVYEIPRGERAKVVFEVCDYKGRRRVHVRTWFRNDEEEWIPTRRGVCLDADLAGELSKGVSLLWEAVNGAGQGSGEGQGV